MTNRVFDQKAFERYLHRIEIFLQRPLPRNIDFDYRLAYDTDVGPMEVADHIKKLIKKKYNS